jgi:hypothetical protein
MAREQIAMTRREVLDFLSRQPWVMLGTLDPDGSPWGDIAPSTLEGETLYVAVGRDTRSHRNLGRDPRACCAADQFPSYYEIKGVTAHGRLRPVDDTELAHRLSGGQADVAVYALGIDDVASFDFTKIQRRY